MGNNFWFLGSSTETPTDVNDLILEAIGDNPGIITDSLLVRVRAAANYWADKLNSRPNITSIFWGWFAGGGYFRQRLERLKKNHGLNVILYHGTNHYYSKEVFAQIIEEFGLENLNKDKTTRLVAADRMEELGNAKAAADLRKAIKFR